MAIRIYCVTLAEELSEIGFGHYLALWLSEEIGSPSMSVSLVFQLVELKVEWNNQDEEYGITPVVLQTRA